MDFTRSSTIAVILIYAAGAQLAAAEQVIHGNTIEGVRNTRCCEIIPVVRDGLHLTATLYNTLGHDDGPAEA